jgi:hypothetical protein
MLIISLIEMRAADGLDLTFFGQQIAGSRGVTAPGAD